MKFTISCLLTIQILHIKFGKDWPLERKMLTYDARRTMDFDGRQTIAIGHLSDSGYLKTIW